MMKLVELPKKEDPRWKEAASFLHDLAERAAKGDILDIVVVFNDKEEACFSSWGDFSDRWRLLGALEYAKAGVHNN